MWLIADNIIKKNDKKIMPGEKFQTNKDEGEDLIKRKAARLAETDTNDEEKKKAEAEKIDSKGKSKDQETGTGETEDEE